MITSLLEYEKIIPALLDYGMHLCTADGAAVLLLDEQKSTLLFLVTRGSLASLTRPAPDSEAFQTLSNLAQPIQADAATLQSFFPLAAIHGISLIVPINSMGAQIGVAIVNRLRSDNLFSRADESALFTLASFSGVALENARRYAQAGEQNRAQERNTVAKAIHSGAAQTVFILGMEAETGLEITDPAEMRQRLITLRHLAVRAGEELRGLINAMRSTQEQRQNPIVPLVQKRLNSFHAQTDIPVAFYVSALPEVFPVRVSEAIYRLIVEYTSTHSHPVSIAGVMISMASNLGKVVVQILDLPEGENEADLNESKDLEGLRAIVESAGEGTFSFSPMDEAGRLICASFDVVS